MSANTLFRFATAGSVDDGKSTLVGRLLHDSKAILADQLESVSKTSIERGFDGSGRIDFALLTDGLRAEREQGITIDVAYRYFASDQRSFILADCPGHVQYTRNMVTGATTADAVVVLVDARKGVLEQTRRHLAVVSLLRVPHVIVAVNKIDLLDFDERVFRRVENDIYQVARELELEDVYVIPVSALEGDNVVVRSESTPWYDGPALLELLTALPVDDDIDIATAPLRLPVQTVLRPQGALAPGVDEDTFRDYRAYAGSVSSGILAVGDEVQVLPDGQRSSVIGIDQDGESIEVAFAPQAVAVRLADDLDVARGHVIVAADSAAAPVREFSASLFWLDPRPLAAGARVLIKYGTATVQSIVRELHGRRNLDTLALEPTELLEINDIGTVGIFVASPLPVIEYAVNRRSGAFVVIDPNDGSTLAAGTIG